MERTRGGAFCFNGFNFEENFWIPMEIWWPHGNHQNDRHPRCLFLRRDLGNSRRTFYVIVLVSNGRIDSSHVRYFTKRSGDMSVYFYTSFFSFNDIVSPNCILSFYIPNRMKNTHQFRWWFQLIYIISSLGIHDAPTWRLLVNQPPTPTMLLVRFGEATSPVVSLDE